MRKILLAAGVALLASFPAHAENRKFPDKAIQIVVPFAPGSSDIQLRVMEPILSEILGQRILIENRAGAGGELGTSYVSKAAPDGYTLLYASFQVLTTIPSLREVGYSRDDFVPIGTSTGTPLLLTSSIDTPYNDVTELIAYAKANPGTVTLGHAGFGSASHLYGEVFRALAGVNIVSVPFTGSGQVLVSQLAGDVNLNFNLPSAPREHVVAGKLKAIGITGSEPFEYWPGVPTLLEHGIEFTDVTKLGLFAPKGTPPEVVEVLEAAFAKAVQSKEYAEFTEKSGLGLLYLNSRQTEEALAADEAFWREHFENIPELKQQ